MSPPPPDRDLLFGLLALQMDFVSRDDLLAALQAWLLDKTRPLGQVLCDRGALTAEHRALLDALVQEHLKRHGHDPHYSLSSVRFLRLLCEELGPLAGADVRASLASFGAETRVEERPAGPGAPADGARYRKLRPHAHGGLGEVFVALDTELHREVALKEIRPHRADDPASRARFLLEAEVTGGLEHPGVVPVYGLGFHPDGRPYYAMRFIKGDSLKAEIDHFHANEGPGRDPGERRLAFRGLLRRFVDVCNALAYAHSRGVLHRDLKPANVMLGPFGETLVVDWGLAKAGVGPHGGPNGARHVTADAALRPSSGSTRHATQAGAALGTPVYMSPEQAEGRLDDLGPACDIYSLGATLYVLLTGRKPFEGASSEEILERVRRGRFAAPRRRKPDTPRALDAVCRKAMALRPEDRYATALDLAADVEHFLADEPVGAWREPWTARAGRWARRHRTALVAGAVFLASAVVALAASTVLVWREQRRTAAQKQVAEQNYQLARDLSFNGVRLVESAEAQFAAVPSLHRPRKDFLDAASRAFRQYLEQQPDDPELRERTAQVYRFAANVHRLTDETGPADSLYREARRLYEELAGQYPDEARFRARLSETLRDQAKLQSNVGRLREATETLRQSVAIAGRLPEEGPDGPSHRRTLAAALLDLGAAEYRRGRTAESEKAAGRAADLFRGLLDLPPGQAHPYDPLLLAAALNVRALDARESGHPEAARPLHEEAVALLREMAERRPEGVNRTDVLHFLAACRLEQAETWAPDPARRGPAEHNLGEAAVQWDELAKDFPGIPMYREALAAAYLARGRLRADDGRPDEARADFEQARQLLEALRKESPRAPGIQADLGRAYLGLAQLARRAGNRAAAADLFGKAAEALDAAVAQSPENAQDRRSLEEVRAEQAR